MSTTYQLIAGSQTYDLDGVDLPHHVALDGLGAPAITRRVVERPGTVPSTDDGWRVAPRKLTLTAFLQATSKSNADGLRDELYWALSPIRQPFTLRATRDDAAVRDLSVVVDGEVLLDEGDRDEQGSQLVVIPLLAPDPIWKATSETTITLTPSGTSHTFGADIYWPTLPVIDWRGQAGFGTSIKFEYDMANHAEVRLGATLPDGETLRIDVANRRTHLLSGNTISADIVSASYAGIQHEFVIEPSITVSTTWSGTNANAQCEIRYYANYPGL